MRKLLFSGVAVGAIAASSGAFACAGSPPLNGPSVGSNTCGPEYLITFAANGNITTALNPSYSGVNPGPYDGIDDTWFGVVNNSAGTITSIRLASTTGASIGGFDGDGINAFQGLPNNSKDTSIGGYGGPDAWFTNNTITALTVNFPGIAPGGTDTFSLEEAVSISHLVPGVPEPSTWGMMLLGFAGLGYAGYRKSRNRLAPAVT